jgi:acid phosphatase
MTILRRVLLAAMLAAGLLPQAAADASAASAPQITKLMVYMMENTSQAVAYQGMPYLNSLASRYGKATNYFALTRASQGNYVEMISGQGAGTCGLFDPPPSQCSQPGGTVFGQAISKGLTAKLYKEGMSSNCSPATEYGHNPWLFFPAEANLCQQFDVPSGEPSGGNLEADIVKGTLPNAGMIVPNNSNNAHTGSLAAADAYLHGWMDQIFAGPDWASGHLAVILTFDEGGATQDVADVFVSPTVTPGTVFSWRANHDSTSRLYSQMVAVSDEQRGVGHRPGASVRHWRLDRAGPERSGGGHGRDADRAGLLAGGLGWRGVHLRRRRVLRLHGRAQAEPSDHRNDGRSHRRWLPPRRLGRGHIQLWRAVLRQLGLRPAVVTRWQHGLIERRARLFPSRLRRNGVCLRRRPVAGSA